MTEVIHHSILGASGRDRWKNCSGSVALAKKFPDLGKDASEEKLYRKLGTAAHEVAEQCLVGGRDAWEFAGTEVKGVMIGHGDDMVDPADVQIYVDACRATLDPEKPNRWVEHRVGSQAQYQPHPLFFGTLDWASLKGDTLFVRDLKFGEGKFVDAYKNEQCLYYVYGLLFEWRVQKLPILRPDLKINIGIVQPRFYGEDPVRTWETTAAEVLKWGDDVLVPSMWAVDDTTNFVPGEHCLFCPVKLACPALKGMYAAAAKADSGDLRLLNDDELGWEYSMREAVKKRLAAIEEETYTRLMRGARPWNTKLVPKKANRVFKTESIPLIAAKYGPQAYTEPSLKTPAQLEKLGGDAKDFVSEHAYTPDTGFTVALATDRRTEVVVPNAQETYAHILAQQK